MKNKIFILGLGVILAYTSASFADEKASNDPIGGVSAFKREFTLNLDECAKNIKRDGRGSIKCEVKVFPKSDEEIVVSTSLSDLDGYEISVGSFLLQIESYGYLITAYPGDESFIDFTDEEFLKVAAKLISKFKKGHVKLLKIVR